jgi:hypothetical protein
MIKFAFAAALIGLCAVVGPAFAQDSAPSDPGAQQSDQKFLGIDLDNRTVYYNGRNSGVYCIYQTVPVYNRYNGYYEQHRVRRCGRGLYVGRSW